MTPPPDEPNPERAPTAAPENRDATSGSWTAISPADVPDPITATGPYVELALEHPSLVATRHAGSFWPAALPYRISDEQRVWYWCDRLASASKPVAATSAGWCATPNLLYQVEPGQPCTPRLVDATATGHELTVDATIAGDSTTAHVAGYTPPAVAIAELTPHAVELTVDDDPVVVPVRESTTLDCPPQTVERLDDAATPDTAHPDAVNSESAGSHEPRTPNTGNDEENGTHIMVTPRLRVRYPGPRAIYHPPPDGDYLLFPSFGIDLETARSRVPIDPDTPDRDLDAIADALDATVDSRPYPERVLWEAFCYAAFPLDHEEATQLTQFENGLLGVLDPPDSMR